MQTKEMPPQMRIVVAILCLFVAVILIVFTIDGVYSKVMLKSTMVETIGILDSKTITHSKNGYKYYLKYHFTVNNVDYKRTWLFGLIEKSTSVPITTYNLYENGTEIGIKYAKSNPKISVIKDITNERSYLMWELIGIVVFSTGAINEMKQSRKQRGNV